MQNVITFDVGTKIDTLIVSLTQKNISCDWSPP